MNEVPDEEKCFVITKDGPICGYTEKTENGARVVFKGIPYAKPPVGHLRFMHPVPVQPWTEVKDCTKDPPLPLSLTLQHTIVGSEDCLYIEVVTPRIKPDKLLPVMFWVGCYGFAYIYDDIYDSSFLTAQDVLFIRCGFRVGPFGFLSIQDFTAPGNSGLKDIIMALKWVQKNIAEFGGDPNNVTLFGNSTGGTLVHLVMLSPVGTGLFHKVIIQSACALTNWSIAKNASKAVIQLAKMLGIEKTIEMEIVEELRSESMSSAVIMDAFKLMLLQMKENNDTNLFDAIFKPCIELEFEGQSAFLTRNPATILKSGNFNKVPLIIGSNNIEGAILEYFKKDFYNFQKYNDNVSLLVPKSLGGENKISKTLGEKLVKFYMGGEDQLREDTKTQYLQLISDYYFLYYLNKTVRTHIQYAPDCPIYYYIMNYAGEWSVPFEYEVVNSMGHSAEIPFIFGFKPTGKVFSKGSRDSVKTRSRVVKMWTNFAKYGNPTPDDNDPLLQITWDPVENVDRLNYLSIGSELTKGRNPYKERMKFWDDLHRDNTFFRAHIYFNDMGVQF